VEPSWGFVLRRFQENGKYKPAMIARKGFLNCRGKPLRSQHGVLDVVPHSIAVVQFFEDRPRVDFAITSILVSGTMTRKPRIERNGMNFHGTVLDPALSLIAYTTIRNYAER